MKKGINKSILFYIASVLFFIASAIGFTSGNESSMAIVWLCLGSSFLCLFQCERPSFESQHTE